MTVGSWSPEGDQDKQPPSIDMATLAPLLACCQPEQLSAISSQLDKEIINSHAWLMRTHKDSWLTIATQLSDQQLLDLVRFFTLAEQQLPGWEAESRSPVIWLCRELKNRKLFPDSSLIQWIRDNSNNRFLPYGNILDL